MGQVADWEIRLDCRHIYAKAVLVPEVVDKLILRSGQIVDDIIYEVDVVSRHMLNDGLNIGWRGNVLRTVCVVANGCTALDDSVVVCNSEQMSPSSL